MRPGKPGRQLARLAWLSFTIVAGVAACAIVLLLFALNTRSAYAAPGHLPLPSVAAQFPSPRPLPTLFSTHPEQARRLGVRAGAAGTDVRMGVLAQGGSADLVLSKGHNPAVVDAGTTLTYTLFVVNTGPSSATSVLLSDTLPMSMTFVSAVPMPSSQNGRTLSWNLGTLVDGDWRAILLVVTVTSDARGSVINTAEATSTRPDPDPTNNIEFDITPVTQKADLEIQKHDAPDPVLANQALTFTLTITNHGPSDADDVVITDTLPSSVTVVDVQPMTSTQVGQTLFWTIDRFARDESLVLTVVSTVDREVLGTITNTAAVDAHTTDLKSGNNQYVETTVVTESADLVIGKLDDPDPVVAGSALTYTLVVTNSGPLDARDVTVTDSLPPGVTFVGATLTPSVQVGPLVVWNLGTVASGEVQTIGVRTEVASGMLGVVTNAVTVTTTTHDPVLGDNAAMASTAIGAEADLVISKSDDPDPVIASQMLTYTLTIANLGPSDAVEVVVTDTLS